MNNEKRQEINQHIANTLLLLNDARRIFDELSHLMKSIHTILNAEENPIMKQGKLAAIASAGAAVADSYSNMLDIANDDAAIFMDDLEAYMKWNIEKARAEMFKNEQSE